MKIPTSWVAWLGVILFGILSFLSGGATIVWMLAEGPGPNGRMVASKMYVYFPLAGLAFLLSTVGMLWCLIAAIAPGGIRWKD